MLLICLGFDVGTPVTAANLSGNLRWVDTQFGPTLSGKI